MRWVLDTNVVIAGLLWTGHPNRLLDLAIDGKVTLYSSPTLIDELAQTLRHSKFSRRIEQCGTTPSTLTVRYSALVTMMSPTQVPRVVENDADDRGLRVSSHIPTVKRGYASEIRGQTRARPRFAEKRGKNSDTAFPHVLPEPLRLLRRDHNPMPREARTFTNSAAFSNPSSRVWRTLARWL
ncbi:hypothetical protein ACCAA_170025 [Candidatus Accumulibacter aalborgensis]|uniref:PIN domain-containing protein n=1 Tax=Candidatus Accumulibacter aalborgensis TaxID=1860102 RepID=A0A1A8XHI9_9PROT|nr:hypothetical protein ACCAA_170025 [Candidatus Accumulibacter aalborgensis]